MSKKVVSRAKNKQGSSTSRILIVPVLAIAGWLTTIFPNVAVAASYSNDYSVCAGRLLSVGVTAEAASQGCAKALHPRDLAACVTKIEKQTQIAATDALSSCGKARRPEELSTCVVGVSSSTQEAVNPAALDYCGRSLLPVRFGQCVVGLRSSKVDLQATQILETCIDAGDSVIGASSSSTPQNIIPAGSSPSPEITPIPTPQPLIPAQPVVPTQPIVPTQPGTN
ncbi:MULTISPECIES: hypothetical protein [unclassified Nostoc]|uniref:hypothetical protein n=1 Tax=unclassified Nostoc TaxID=2593658 RepID=UPI002612E027|nr:hypothetical protein [Nostoc sp. S13]MDF5734970.1 hypothetical protein [Nostoc sp. S13]